MLSAGKEKGEKGKGKGDKGKDKGKCKEKGKGKEKGKDGTFRTVSFNSSLATTQLEV